MTVYLGDFAAGATIYIPFHTFNSSGASVTITGLAVTDIEVYKNGSVTQRASDAGYTLLDTDGIDFDALTGIHGFSINTGDNTDAGFYASGADYWVVVSAITVDAQTVSFVAAIFSIENRCALRPTTAGRTLDVSAGGEAGLDWANIGSPTTAQNLSATNIDVDQVVASVSGAVGSVTGAVGSVTGAVGSVTGAVGSVASGGLTEASFATTAGSFTPLGIVDQGTAQAATGTTLQLRAAAGFANDELLGAVIHIVSATAGAGQSRVITDYVGATDTATVDAWTTTPTGTIVYKVFAAAPASASAPIPVTVSPGGITATSFAAGAIDATAIATDAITDAKVASDVTIASVTGAVGSVTGNVGGNVVGSVASVAGNVTGSVGSVAAGGITAASVATGAVDADALATDAVTEIADAVLDRNMATGTDSGSPTVRTVRQALRASRNRVAIAAGTATVYKEDDATASWTAAVTTTAGNPVSEIDPASA